MFRGFPEFRSNVLYCPKQFFTVVVPHSSVNCIRVVAHMLRKTLGWVDESGDPIQEQHAFSYRDLEQSAGVSHSRLGEALDDALKLNFVRRVQKARMQIQGVTAKSAAYELRWDDQRYTDSPKEFQGFYLRPHYIDSSGQDRTGRKNIPNIFFDHVIKHENRRLIRVVGTLLWYSIDWGKGGERRTTVKRSIRDLVELTQLTRANVSRALDEAIETGYIERVEPGLFDLAGNRQGFITVYGICWTKNYTYGHDGTPVEVATISERSQKEVRPVQPNAPKKRPELELGTLPKRGPKETLERSQKEARNAPKKRPEERSQKEAIRITNTNIPNTLINNNTGADFPAPQNIAAAAAEEALLNVGFSKHDSRTIVRTASEVFGDEQVSEIVKRQISLLPKRNPTKPLGMLRRAIEGNWPDPQSETTDVGSFSGKTFAANFYAGYHGNPDAPVSEPSSGDSEAADQFVKRLLEVSSDQAEIPTWGREFGMLVAREHGQKHQSLPALRLAIQRYGDNFYSRLKASFETQRRRTAEEAHKEHYQKWHAAYMLYLEEQVAQHQAANSNLFQVLVAEENDKLKTLRKNQFGLNNIEELCAQHLAGRFERFERLIVLEQDHGVLDFWAWDKKQNPECFREVSL